MVADIKNSIIKPGQPGGSIGNLDPKNSNVPGKDGGEFGEILKAKIPGGAGAESAKASASAQLKFSNHAIERMASRGISFKPEELTKLNDAVEKAAQKGSRESLILMGDNALIVSVKNRTVVTAMDREQMKENVFTNIDSTVIL